MSVFAQAIPAHRIYRAGEDVVFLICGFQARQTCWRPILPWIMPQLTIVTLDNRGVGSTSCSNEPLSVEAMAADVLRLADELQIKRFFLVGHSMGGAIAQLIARNDPRRVRALALCNSFCKLGSDSATVLNEIRRQLDEGGDPAVISLRLAEDFLSAGPLRQAAQELIGRNTTAQERELGNGFRSQLDALTAFDSRSWLHQIKAPTLIVHSQMDRPSFAVEAAFMARELRHARCTILLGGHMSMVEQPKALGQALLMFFANHGLA